MSDLVRAQINPKSISQHTPFAISTMSETEFDMSNVIQRNQREWRCQQKGRSGINKSIKTVDTESIAVLISAMISVELNADTETIDTIVHDY